jgi:hypothetical protein
MGFLNSGIAEGLNQTTGNMVNMGMQLYQHKAQQAIQQERLRVEQETATRRNKLLDMQIAQHQKETELIPIETQLTKLGFTSPEEHQLFMSKIPLDIEEVAGTKYVQRKKGVEHFTKLAADPEFNIDLGNIRTKNIDKELAQLSNPETTAKLKPEELQKVEQQKTALIEQKTMLANQMKIEQLKIKGGRLINVPQGTKTIDPVTGETVADNPKEESNVAFSGGSSFDKRTGKPIYIKPEKGRDPEVKAEKEIEKADKRIQGVINGYDAQIAIFEKKLAAAEKAEDDKAIKRWTDSIDNFQQEKSKAINTQNQLRNGTLPPDKIMWGGDKGNSTGTYKTADDVKAAFKSGKIKEVEAVKILKDKFGMK